MTIGDKLSVFEENSDDNSENDIYEVSLNFALVVTPDADKDDLIVLVAGNVPGVEGSTNFILVHRIGEADH